MATGEVCDIEFLLCMDVIVDTCILLTSPSMSSTDFKTLFNYLHASDSKLIIPRIVFDELMARYPEKLSEHHERASSAIGLLNATLATPTIPPVPDIHVANETMRYLALLNSGTFPLRVMPDYSDISIAEVAQRGIKRMPPATTKGEQLRDVMVWLASLSYFRTSQKPVVLITGDGTFWKGGKIKDELSDELSRDGIEMQVFPSIKEFLKAIALTAIKVSRDWLARYVSTDKLKELFDEFAPYISYGRFRGERSMDVLWSEIDFRGGELYGLGQGAQIAEVEVGGRFLLRVADWPYPPPEATLPPEEAQEERKHRKPTWYQDYNLNGSLFLSLRVQDEKLLSITPDRFEYEDTPETTHLAPSPRQFQTG